MALIFQNFRFDIILVALFLQVLTHALSVLTLTEASTLDFPIFILLGEVSVTVVVDGGSEGLDLLEIVLGVGTVGEGSQLDGVADFGLWVGSRFGLEVLLNLLSGLEPESQDAVHRPNPAHGGVRMEPNAVPFKVATTASIEIPSPLHIGEDVQNEVLELREGDFGGGDDEEQSAAEIELRALPGPAHGGPVGRIVDVLGLIVHSLALGDELGIDRDVALPVLASIESTIGNFSQCGEAQAHITRRLRLGDDLAVALEVPDTAPRGGPEEASVEKHVGISHETPHLVRTQRGFRAERYGALSERKFGTYDNPQGLTLHLSGIERTILIVGEMVGQSGIPGYVIIGDLELTHPGYLPAA